MDRKRLEDWVRRYEEAWRTPGTGGLSGLFTPEATYRTGPYDEPHAGLEAIAEMWEAERAGHDEPFAMRSEIVAVDGDTGVVRLQVDYHADPGTQWRDIWIVRLDDEGRCFHFEEWPVAPG